MLLMFVLISYASAHPHSRSLKGKKHSRKRSHSDSAAPTAPAGQGKQTSHGAAQPSEVESSNMMLPFETAQTTSSDSIGQTLILIGLAVVASVALVAGARKSALEAHEEEYIEPEIRDTKSSTNSSTYSSFTISI